MHKRTPSYFIIVTFLAISALGVCSTQAAAKSSTRDRTPPRLDIEYPSSTKSKSVRIYGSVSKDTASLEVNGERISIKKNGSFKIRNVSLPEKENVFKLEAKDKAGNTTKKKIKIISYWDSTPPVILITGVEQGGVYNPGVKPDIQISDTQSPVTEKIRLDRELFVSGTAITAEGKYTLNVKAVDSYENSTKRSVTFKIVPPKPPDPPVPPVNRPPVLDFISNFTVYDGETVTLKPTASDPDGDVLTFTYSGWMSSSNYTVQHNDSGSHTVTVSVSDGKDMDSQDVIVTVNVCGDSVLNGNEICDDGAQNGSPNKCNVQCTGTTIPVCGNNVLEANEGCDDGNKTSGDGCSALCVKESCGDSIVQTGLGEECEGSGTQDCIIGGYAGKKICGTNCKLGTCAATESCGDGIKNGVEVCDEGTNNGSPIHCNSQCAGIASPVCGNNAVESGEGCDDGNKTSGDGCSLSCVIELCGDGIVQTALGETCEGNSIKSCMSGGYNGVQSCAANCTYGTCLVSESCGDGSVQTASGEACDDGNKTSGDGCSVACKLEICGDKIVQTGLGEQCDDGNKIVGDGCNASCKDEYCGDEIIQTSSGEVCDLNSRSCTTSSGYPGSQDCNVQCTAFVACASALFCGDGICTNPAETTVSCPSDCPSACGNGIAEPSEECDDGNKASGDGCSSACKIEFCGDGVVQAIQGEECDDGNKTSGDGCGKGCLREQLADTTAPSVPTGLNATAVSTSQINISWNASMDNVGSAGYRIFRNNIQAATATTASYSNAGLSPNANYSFTVSAYDAAGNESAESASASATTPALPDATPSGAPVIFYTDILSGPNTGGENNNGAYLSIFGKGFGTTRGTSTVKINGVEVAAYKQWGAPSKVFDSHGIQVITVQPGPNVTSGQIIVTAGGKTSNSDHTFTVKPGDIYFVATNGNDTTGVIGDITKPFRNIPVVYSRSDFGPGDTIVVRGGTYTYDDNGGFLRADKWGVHEEPAGSGAWVFDDYLMIIGYPGEEVLIDNPQDGNTTAGIYFYKGKGGNLFANMHQNQRGGGNNFFNFNSDSAQHYVRIVNWEMEDMQGGGGGAGGISASGTHHKLLGINSHNIGTSKLYHNIYFSMRSSLDTFDVEIAFSHIWDNKTGRGIQFYDTDPYEIKNLSIHDNVIHDIGLHGIALSDHTTTGISIYNNIMYNTGNGTGDGSKGGIGFAWASLEANVYNNVFYDVGGDGAFDLNKAKSVTIRNNVSYANSGQNWYTEDAGFDWNNIVTATNNIWYGSSQLLPSWDTNPITSDPLLVDPSYPARNFHLQVGSPAIDAGTAVSVSRDFDGIMRPQGLGYDIGAYEYCTSNCPVVSFADPVILYTDILSGSNTGGENNNGAYLSIFGKGFGATKGSSTVTINGVEVAAYKQWGAPSKVYDSHGIQVITVQPGPNVLSGSIVVTVNGEKSNSNHTFTVRSGKIFFTDYAKGNDTNDGSINSPKKSVQNLWNDRAVYNPGDIIVMRGQTYTVAQAGDTFVKFKSHSMGTPENPTIIMGYPGEDVFIDMRVSGGAEIFSTSTGSPPTGDGLILSNFRAHTGGASAIRFNNVDYGRLVNAEIEGMYLLGNGTGMISSHSDFTHILGNKSHNSGQNKYYHSIYWSDQGHDNEISWNHIYDIRGGRAIQVYDGGTTPFYNFAVHDNVIHDVDRDGINFGGPSTTGIKIYNNIIYRTGLGTSDECCGKGGNAGRSGIQMTGGLLDGSEIFNNTLFDNHGDEGQIRLAGKNMKIYNNIFYADTCFRNNSAGQTGCTDNNGQYFYSLESYLDTSTLTARNNVWFSAVQPPRQAVPSWDTNPITSDPKFVDPTNPARNFHLQTDSSAIDTGIAVSVSRDFDGITRPQGIAFDMGAYEYNQNTPPPPPDTTPPAAPVVLYTDILSGPNTGGENNNGAYLSIFGKGFGTTRGTSTVTINGVEVAAYKQWGAPSKVYDSHGIQVITVQPGVNVTSGSIIVTVGGAASNSDHTFKVHAGDIYFVDGQTGNNSTGVANDITKPYLGVQYVSDLLQFGAGDTIVIRGGTYSVSGQGANFLRWDPLSGTVDSPMAVIGYPGETINIKKGLTGECRFSYYNGGGSYSTTANLNLDCNPNSTAFLSNAYVGNVRIVNNDFKGMHGSSGGSGLVTGAWHHTKILGNAVHEIGDTKLYHGIYLSCTDTSLAEDIEVGWNHVYDAFYGAACGTGSEDCSGRLIQLYNGLGPGFSNVSIHDNVLHDGSRHAISLGYTATGIKVYNNIIYRTGLGVDQESGIRINHSGVVGAEWYNNVGYDNANGLFAFDSGSSVTVRNNINVVLPGQIYESGAMNRNNITDSNNLFYGAGSPPSWADPATSVNADPLFVDPTLPARNFHLQSGSPAIDSGVLTSFPRDFDGKIRPIGTAFDIGAYEDQ